MTQSTQARIDELAHEIKLSERMINLIVSTHQDTNRLAERYATDVCVEYYAKAETAHSEMMTLQRQLAENAKPRRIKKLFKSK